MASLESGLEAVLPSGQKEITASVIVPIYNAEATLERCLEALRCQTEPNFEVWMVNDGSTDGSEAICRRFAAEDGRFHLVTQENGGVSAARNAGLERAAGKYLLFADSDDVPGADFVRHLTDAMEGCQMAVCNYYECSGEKAEPKDYARGRLTLRQYMLDMAKHPIHNYYTVLWNRCFLGELVRQNGLRFDTAASYGEDTAFVLGYLRHVGQVNTISGFDYRYTYAQKASLSRGGEGRAFLDQTAFVYRQYAAFWKDMGWYRRYKPLVQFYGARLYYEALNRCAEADRAYLYRVCLTENGFGKWDLLPFAAMRRVKKLLKRGA